MRFVKTLLICGFLFSQSGLAHATVLTAEDLAGTYVNEELGVSIKIPHTWIYATSGKVIDQALDTAQELASKVMGIPKEMVSEVTSESLKKAILIRMRGKHFAVPVVQITTRSFENMGTPPQSAMEHLSAYMQFVENMTAITVVESLKETELNGSPCAHVSYFTEIMLEGYTYLAKYDVYTFWRPDRTIDLTIIDDRNAAFKAQNEMDIRTVLNSARIDA